MRFYILLNDFSNFLLNLSRWFFGYQYFQTAMVLPQLFNVAVFQTLKTPLL